MAQPQLPRLRLKLIGSGVLLLAYLGIALGTWLIAAADLNPVTGVTRILAPAAVLLLGFVVLNKAGGAAQEAAPAANSGAKVMLTIGALLTVAEVLGAWIVYVLVLLAWWLAPASLAAYWALDPSD